MEDLTNVPADAQLPPEHLDRVVFNFDNYRKVVPVKAIQIHYPFTAMGKSGPTTGKTGDYLLEWGEGDRGACDKDTFESMYVHI